MYSTVLYSTVQHSTVQYSTVQYSKVVLYSTTDPMNPVWTLFAQLLRGGVEGVRLGMRDRKSVVRERV